MKHIYGKYYCREKERPAGSESFRRRGGAMHPLAVISTPALAAEEIADREHGEKSMRERIEEEIMSENGRF